MFNINRSSQLFAIFSIVGGQVDHMTARALNNPATLTKTFLSHIMPCNGPDAQQLLVVNIFVGLNCKNRLRNLRSNT